jgi:probable RNA-binding protein EIF1AD
MNKRRTPYRKNVEKDVLEALPEPTENQHIVKVIKSHGSNIFEVTFPPTDDGTKSVATLARLPTRFRKLIWVKRGTYLICSSADEDYQTSSGEKGRVTMNVEYVLFELQVKHLQKRSLWPEAWSTAFNGVTEYSKDEMTEKLNDSAANPSGGSGEKKTDGSCDGGDGTYEQEQVDDDSDLFVNRNRIQYDSDTDFSSDDD